MRLRDPCWLRLANIPLLLNTTWELVQWGGFTDGRGDAADVLAGLVGWAIAEALLFQPNHELEQIPQLKHWRTAVLAGGLLIMGLADVLK